MQLLQLPAHATAGRKTSNSQIARRTRKAPPPTGNFGRLFHTGQTRGGRLKSMMIIISVAFHPLSGGGGRPTQCDLPWAPHPLQLWTALPTLYPTYTRNCRVDPVRCTTFTLLGWTQVAGWDLRSLPHRFTYTSPPLEEIVESATSFLIASPAACQPLHTAVVKPRTRWRVTSDHSRSERWTACCRARCRTVSHAPLT